MEGNEALGDGLAGGVGLADGTTTADGDVELQTGELSGADDVDCLQDLRAEGFREDLEERDAVDADLALSGLADGGDGDRGLLLAEGLHTLHRVLLLGVSHAVL